MALSTLTGSCWAALRRTISRFREIAERDVVLVGDQPAPSERGRGDRAGAAGAFVLGA
jgi:hypothetical protein